MILNKNWKEALYKMAYKQQKREFGVEDFVNFVELNSFAPKTYAPTNHSTRDRIMGLLKECGELRLGYRSIGRLIGEEGIINSQNIKYHLEYLETTGEIYIDRLCKKVTIKK